MLRSTLLVWHEILNLLEDAQRCDSWEYFPLERRHTVDSIHILEVIVFLIPLNFALPSCNRIISHFSHAERTESEKTKVLFGVGDPISLFAQQACRHPRSISETHSAYTSDFFFVH